MDYDADDLSDCSSLTSVPSSPLSSPPLSPLVSPNHDDPFTRLTPPLSQNAGDDMPPARKRRKIEPRIRTTQHLDLTSETAQSDYDQREAKETLKNALRNRRKIVVIAGAGISVSAGIPDFRSSQGLFKSLRGEHNLKGSGKQLFDASVYKDDLSTSHFHDMVRQLSTLAKNAKPTAFHRMLARLSTEDRLLRLYTQNVDGLETCLEPLETTVPLAHKGPWPKTVQLHGGLEKMMCQKCRQVTDFDATLFEGPKPPACPQCVAEDEARTNVAGKRSHGIGRLRPRMVLYNEHNPDDEAIGAVTTADFRTRPDCVIVVGTSMKIPGVRRIASQMCRIVRDRREGTTIWINHDGVPTGKDLEDCWDLVIKGDSDEVAKIAGLREWNEPIVPDMEPYSDSELEQVKSRQGKVQINLPPTPKKSGLSEEIMNKNLKTAVMTPPRSHTSSSEKALTRNGHPSITLKLKLASRKPDQGTAKSKVSIKNPASSGRKIGDVLSGKENSSKAKSKTSYKRSSTGVVQRESKPTKIQTQSRLSNMAKVTKVRSGTTAMPATKKEPLSPKRESEINSENQLESKGIPTPQYSSEAASPTPEIQDYMSPVDSSMASGQNTVSNSPTWKNRDTISPTGNPPKDFVRLKILN